MMFSVFALPSLCVGAESLVYNGLEYEILDNKTIEITGYVDSSTVLDIPSTIDSKPVTSIGASAFYWYKSLVKVTIPDSVTSIGKGAFSS